MGVLDELNYKLLFEEVSDIAENIPEEFDSRM